MNVSGGGSFFSILKGILYALIVIILLGILIMLLFSIADRVFPGTTARIATLASNLLQREIPFLIKEEGTEAKEGEEGAEEVSSEAAEEPGVPAAQYDRSSYYYRSELIEENLQKLTVSDEKAVLVDREAAPGKKVAVHIDGMLEAEAMDLILQVVERHDTQVSFFITGMQAVESPDVVKRIADAGYEVGNYTLRAQKDLQNLRPEELVEDFTIAGEILKQAAGGTPSRLKANASVYTDELLGAAHASGIENVVQSTNFLTYHSFKDYGEVQNYMQRRTYGDIISVKLSGLLDASEYTPKEIIERPAIDKQESAAAQEVAEETLTEVQRLVRLVDWLLTAIEESDFDPRMVVQRESNAGARAPIINNGHLLTSEPAVGYLFYGLGRQAELDGILDALQTLSGVGTFFVTAEEIEEYPEQVNQLIQAGHSIGIAHYPISGEDFYSVLDKLGNAETLLKVRGVRVRMALQPWGVLSDALQEAASALGLELYTIDITVAREANQNAQETKEVLRAVYGEDIYGFKRGQLMGFRMNYFQNEGLIGKLLLEVEGTYNAYKIKTPYAIFHGEETFIYPLPKESILPEVRDRIHPGQLPEDFMQYVKTHYIGNPDVNSVDQLPGFTKQEIRTLDKKGKVDNVKDVAFFTFDDWGTDVPITKLLDVLAKHNVKATFAIRTRYVLDNPALLRAIAMEGHEIISHTHNHLPLSNLMEGAWRFSELNDAEVEALKQDIQDSYDTLQSIVGDIRLDNGKPALSTLFRPPTLAVGRKGMEAVFDMGMSYIVSGEYTSHDYEAESAAQLLRNLRLNVRNGTVVIMHFSDNSIHTADAVDQYLTMNETNQNRKKYSFARLSDHLGD